MFDASGVGSISNSANVQKRSFRLRGCFGVELFGVCQSCIVILLRALCAAASSLFEGRRHFRSDRDSFVVEIGRLQPGFYGAVQLRRFVLNQGIRHAPMPNSHLKPEQLIWKYQLTG